MTERRSTEAEELIAQLLTELPEPDREIFFRRYYYRESCREIGRRLNMQEHTVNVRLSRGAKSCANSLPRCAILIKRGLQLMRNYTENADSLLEQYPTKTMPLSKQEEKRIYDMALKKIEKAGSYTPPKLKKHRRVPVCVAAAAAATCVLSAGIAAAPYIKELAGGKIVFFTDAKSQAQVQNVLDAPRGEYGGQQTDTEGHNTEIGQTQTLDGVNYTLDTVSMDAATLDCFFTVSGENVMSKFLDADSIYRMGTAQQQYAMDGSANQRRRGNLHDAK